MKFLFDLFPVILFFATFKISEKFPDAAAGWLGQWLGADGLTVSQAPILMATVVVILATIAQVAWAWFRHGKVDKILWISLVLVVVFGGLTLILKDESFIKYKLTLFYWGLAVGMTVAALAFKKNAIRSMLGEQLELPEPVWTKVNASWIGFFLFMGAANLIIAINFSTDVWVNFKMFGGLGLTLMFVLAQGVVLSKYLEDHK